ncbi:MAG: zinc ribbon domain-containing protein [Methanotrichaceae archaeon]
MWLVLIEPAYTSQTCHQCHHIGDRKGKTFSCPFCGWDVDRCSTNYEVMR